jgi:acetyltransferase-like isoleucine patch superfamily enzyme
MAERTDMEDPEALNQAELMEYYGDKGTTGVVKHYARFIYHWTLQAMARHSPHPGLTAQLHRLRGVKLGKHVYIGPEVTLDEIYPGLVIIEDYVSIGMRTMIFCHSNPTCSIEIKKKFYPRVVKPTVIKRGAWVAPGCTILAGTTIGENSVVAAGSVVIRDVEPYTVVGGNPAKPLKKLVAMEAVASG